ncbi:MAG: D-glycerate dehydrogenase [Oligoflexia bacterium]|nr:D-glycerate dehydrogenase [Oligoflexia bacterium]
MRVFVTQEIDPAGLALLRQAGHRVDQRVADSPIAPDALAAALAGCAALVPMPTDRVDAAVLATLGLRVVACHSVGVDHVDLAAARAHGVIVTNTPGVLTDATADLAMALILATARRLGEGERLLRRGDFHGWRPTMLRGMDLAGATLGIVGYGRIGQAVGRRAQAFGMKLLWTRSTQGTPLAELLAHSDIVSLHCPLGPKTHHLIDRAALAAMRPGALLINTARGPVVDEDALADALEAGHLGGAGLDVHAHEPRVHPRLIKREDIVLLPHLGSATWKTRRAMAEKACRNAVAVLAGRVAPDRVAC